MLPSGHGDLAEHHHRRLPAAGALAGDAARGPLVEPRDVGGGRRTRLRAVRAARGARRGSAGVRRRRAAGPAAALLPARLSEYGDELATIVPVPEGAMSIDYLIGGATDVGRGLGKAMIRSGLDRLWVEHPRRDVRDRGDPRRQHPVLQGVGEGRCDPRGQWRDEARQSGRRRPSPRVPPGQARIAEPWITEPWNGSARRGAVGRMTEMDRDRPSRPHRTAPRW